MKRRFIAFLLLLTSTMLWATKVQIEGCWYDIDEINGLAWFTRPNSSYRYSGDVTILSSFLYDEWTYHVIGIADDAFENCTNLKSVTIPNSVTSIGYSAFSNCSKITSITIPSNLTSIDGYAFKGCSGLTTITLPKSVTNIGSYAFSDCQNLTSISLLSDSLACIDKNTFENCRNLTTIVIPNGATSIGENAFKSCSSLVSITIPTSVTAIGQAAFEGCFELTSVYVTDIASWCAINFESHPFDTSKDGNRRNNLNIYLNGSIVENLVIPGNVKCISSKAFQHCKGLRSLTIETGVEEINSNAFFNCENLSSAILPDGIITIGNKAFYNCKDLSSINLPNSIVNIYGDAFSYCSSLTSVTIPNSVTSIGSAFSNCVGLTSVTIPSSVTTIGGDAFSGCVNLTHVNKIGTTCIKIYSDAFYNCHSLTTIDLSCVSYIGRLAFYHCYSLFADLKLADYIYSDANIEDGAFEGVPNVAYSKNGLKPEKWNARCVNGYIEGNLVFSGQYKKELKACSAAAIGTVVIPDGVTDISLRAFTHCSKMTSVTLPSSVTNINGYAFEYCTSLKSMTVKAENPPTLGNNDPFYSSDSLESIYVPCGYNRHYIYNQQWKAYKSLIKYSPLAYSLKVVANHGSVIYPTICDEDTILTVIPNENYHFVQWSDGVTDNPRKIELTQDTTFIAEIAIDSYLVQFFGFNDVLLDSQSVEHGTAATAPEVPKVDHYDFVGWDKEFSNVTSNLDVFAIYQQNTEGIENVNIDTLPQKVVIDGQIYILRGEHVYDAEGKMIK